MGGAAAAAATAAAAPAAAATTAAAAAAAAIFIYRALFQFIDLYRPLYWCCSILRSHRLLSAYLRYVMRSRELTCQLSAYWRYAMRSLLHYSQ